MKTKLLLILPLAIGSLLCSCGGGQEEGGKYTLEFTLNEDGKSYAVTGVSYENKEEEHNVVIPDKYEELPVTVLGNKNANLLDKIYNVLLSENKTSRKNTRDHVRSTRKNITRKNLLCTQETSTF